MKLYNDNAAIYIENSPNFHKITKQIMVDCHSIRDKIQSKIISTEHLQSKWKHVDLLTKAMNLDSINRLNNKLSLCEISDLT